MKNEQIHTDHRSRMRARIAANGILSLADHEILVYLLYPFVPRKGTNPIPHALMDKFGSFSAVLDADPAALATIPNMTKGAALFLSSLSDVARKFCSDAGAERPRVDTYERATGYLVKLMKNLGEERIYALFVDNSGRLKEKCELGSGTADECRIRVNELVMLCQNFQTKYVYLAHNHPAGVAKPSFSDVEFTKWAIAALEVLGVRLVDHIIVAGDKTYSFKQDGMMDRFKSGYLDFIRNGRLTSPGRNDR